MNNTKKLQIPSVNMDRPHSRRGFGTLGRCLELR